MMTFIRIMGLVFALALGLAASSARAAEPADTLRRLGTDLSAAVTLAQADAEAGHAELARIIGEAVEIDTLARHSLPPDFADRVDGAYLAAFRDWLIRAALAAGPLEIDPYGVSPMGPFTLVDVRVIGAGVGEAGLVTVFTRRKAARYRITDLRLEAGLLTQILQEAFLPHLIAGDMPALIAHLRGDRPL